MIVPTPLHAKRYLHRRFNQSAKAGTPVMPAKSNWHLCSRGIDAAKGWQTTGRIEQKPATAQSSRRVYRAKRPASPHRQAAPAGDDDVITAGATLCETAKTPHRAGSGPVRGLVLARILRNGL